VLKNHEWLLGRQGWCDPHAKRDLPGAGSEGAIGAAEKRPSRDPKFDSFCLRLPTTLALPFEENT
jgi:hypothetical protein